MYLDYFNFKEEPFGLTPDPKFYYLSRHHEEAIESLLFGISNRKGFMLLIGDIGTGKTTTCRTLLSRIDKNVDTSVIFNPMLSIQELLESINQDFGNKSSDGKTVKGQIDALNDFLLQRLKKNKNAIVLIDEAQILSIDALEMLRLLSNIETQEKKLVQIIFVGQRELAAKLNKPELRQLNQRITIRCELTPLSFVDMCQYIIHRVQIAAFSNCAGVKFEQKALKLVYQYTQGTPRLINVLCDRVLMEMYSRKERLVTGQVVKDSRDDLGATIDIAGVLRSRPKPWQFWKWF